MTNDTNKRQSVTTKEIANIYSHLQNMMETTSLKQQRRLSNDSWLPITPAYSSSSLHKPTRPDCPCHHIIISNHSRFCALCDRRIPILDELHQENEKIQQALLDCQETLSAERKQSQRLEKNQVKIKKEKEETIKKLDENSKGYASLQQDLKAIQEKLTTEKRVAERAKEDKMQVEGELEELSTRLFEEANKMVFSEKREKHKLQTELDHLKEELKGCRGKMEVKEMELKELKTKMASIDEHHVLSEGEEESDGDEKEALDSVLDPTAWALREFQDFVELSESVSIHKLHSTPFMKHSLMEDIEPCLRFGPQSRLAPKDLYESMLLNTCFIEKVPGDVSDSHPIKCQACGQEKRKLSYRFRTSMVDDWAYMDRYCRDRFVSVCEFYMFIRNIRQGHYNGHNMLELFQESIRLKLQMFYSR
ncbi:hypothetical protein G6F43_006425 [Rhizopus delemar]|nr:hypothetical protein G6F43_006425 [Rhizopus delemar]